MNQNVLINISQNVSLREGSEGVKNFFRIVYQNQGISTRECAKKLKMPIPIVAAIKQEAIKIDLVEPGATLRLTEKGKTFCEIELSLSKYQENICVNCSGLKYVIPTDYLPVLEKLRDILNDRPKVDVTVDQAHGTAETALRRAILALEKGLMFNKKIALLGDDDYVSVAIMLLQKHLFDKNPPRLTVFDIDYRILKHIQKISTELGFDVETIEYDLRNPLSEDFIGKFDAIFTDPPYTLDGAKLFLIRANNLLKNELGKHIFFSFGHKAPKEMIEVQRVVVELGFSFSEIIPSFNQYYGAAILGNVGQMMIIEKAKIQKKKVVAFDRHIYTKKK
ncbi:MAG: bis-aminopropyl spermidine synthase family protein [Clostridia bacterium]